MEFATAQSCTAIASGSWVSSFTWSCSGTNATPACGDTIYIPSSRTVTVENQIDFSGCGSSMVIDVTGNLAFTNGNKIDLPCGSLLSVQSGGAVYKVGSGGGTSTLISICATNVWTAGDGPLSGPISYGGFVLPVELLSFKVNRLDNGNYQFTWTTATETNNDYFTLFSSSDAADWEEVAEVNGAGFSNQVRAYSVELSSNQISGEFFKLVQTDFNGTTEVVGYARSDADLSRSTEAIVWPNPADDKLNLDLSWLGSEVQAVIYSLDGKEQMRWNIQANEQPIYSIETSAFKSGLYFLVLSDAYQSQTARISIR